MRRGIHVRLAWCALLATPSLAGGQSPADDAILAELDAAIGLPSMPDLGAPADPVADDIATGLHELGAYVARGDREAAEQALFRFNRATTRRPDWGWPEYAMAHAFLLLHDYGAPVINSTGARLGEGYLVSMERHLHEALRRDSGLGRARRLFSDLLQPLGARLLPPEIAAFLEVEVSRPDPLSGALLAWARHKRNTGAPGIALPILARAEAAGADPSVVALERARVLAELGQREAADQSFWAAVAQLTPESRDLLNRQLSWLLDADLLEEFRATPDAVVGAWLRRFWGARDAAAMLPAGGALGEHLEHWSLAHRLFRVSEPWDRDATRGTLRQMGYWGDPCTGFPYEPSAPLRLPRAPPLAGDLRGEEPVLTSAGALLLRLGRPMAILHAADSGGGAAAARLREILRTTRWTTLWLYPSEAGYDLFLFPEETITATSNALLTPRLPTARVAPAWHALARVLGASFRGEEPDRVDHAAMLRCEAAFREARDPTPLAAAVPPATAIVDPWGAVMEARVFGREGLAQPLIMVSYAIPTPRLDPGTARPDQAVLAAIRVRLEAHRFDDGVRVSRDTTLSTLIGSDLRAFGFVTGTLQLPVGEGHWSVAMRISQVGADRGAGSFMLRPDLEIGAGPGLAMSDLLASHASLPDARTPLGAIGLNFLGEWPVGAVAMLRHQVLGVPAGEPYVVTTEVIPTDEWPRAALTEVDSVASTAAVHTRLTVVRLEKLSPGPHWFVVTVTAGEESVSRYLEFRVVKP